MILASLPLQAAQQPDITAEAALLMDYYSGEILFQLEAEKRRAPASTTKVMTAILALEYGRLEEEVTISSQAARVSGSSIWLSEGEVLTLEQLIWGLLLNSGNDAAHAIAEHLAGSVEDFALMMNEKARELGAYNTSFKNPHGLPQEGHLTTALDLALITRYAMSNELFCQMVNTRHYRIPWPGHEWDRFLHNSNKLLENYEPAIGVKTGWTTAAGRCLISAALRGDRRLIAVTLHSNRLYQDHIELLEYGFQNFQTRRLVAAGMRAGEMIIPGSREGLSLLAAHDFYLTLNSGHEKRVTRVLRWREDLSPSLKRGQPVAWMEIQVDGVQVGRVPLLAATDYSPSLIRYLWQRLWGQLFIFELTEVCLFGEDFTSERKTTEGNGQGRSSLQAQL